MLHHRNRKRTAAAAFMAALSMTIVLLSWPHSSGESMVETAAPISAEHPSVVITLPIELVPTTVAPTTTTTAPPVKRPAAAKPKVKTTAPPSSGLGVNAFLNCVAKYESGGSYTSHNAEGSGGRYGILVSTWHSLGYSGLPWQGSPADQDQAARTLYDQYGTKPWTTRGRCGG